VKVLRAILMVVLTGAPLALLSQQQAQVDKPQQSQQKGQQQPPPAQPQTQQPPAGRGQGGGGGDQGPGEEGGGRGGRGGFTAATFSGLRLRSIGPATTSGRVAAFAVDPNDRKNYYVASASGGVWKTTNAGTTYTPVFDNYGSYSIGAIAMDPKNTAAVWVGTGENNSQRSVSFGDGIYKSEDAGRTFHNLGLKASEHIGKILIDPRNSDVVYVAAQGPLWGPGGDRGLYKTTDGGKTFKAVLAPSVHTGVTDVVMDPENPDVLFAAAYQRERKTWTLIDGGPESGLYKSTDAGVTWNRVRSGLPMGDIGRIGLAWSQADPRILYATVEAAERRGGIFRSTDRGATWERRNEFDTGAMYYANVVIDPKNPERIFVMNVNIMTSDDGGTTLRALGSRSKHVDNHALWIDPKETDYYLVGCDGGVYESFDRGNNWVFKGNLPVTQFYDVVADTNAPFYNVYGGTQDNYSLGGPARTRNANGIVNADWFVTQGGDGFHSAVDWQDPNTVYAESQDGGLIRFDRHTGERMGIVPQPGKGEPPLRWNWDSPVIVSPHSHTRIYFAANKLFRSDDRGDSWKAISGELSRAVDRNKLPIMGKVWGPDAVSKNASTAFYGNASAVSESAKKEGVLIVGTDDGVVNITEDGGKNWRRIEKFTGVPDMTYINRVLASGHDANTFFVAFDNHKNEDFAPYLLKTVDGGRNWTSIKGDLPERGPIWAIAEDPANANLLFVGTEYGLFFSNNGGQKWLRLQGGLPTIAVADLTVQKQMDDLVLATFGRGFYVLDDYSPLRTATAEALDKEAALFPVKNTMMFLEASPIGGRGKGFQGENYFAAQNPPVGATITYYLKTAVQTKKQKRQQAERAADRGGANAQPPAYPTVDELRAEEEEEAAVVILTVTDAEGHVMRRVDGPATPGIHRVVWDLRCPAANVGAGPGGGGGGGGRGGGGGGGGAAAPPAGGEESAFRAPGGPFVMPGEYKVSLARRADGKTTELAGPVSFTVTAEGVQQMAPEDRAALVAFQQKVARLQNAVTGTLEVATATEQRLGVIQRALEETPGSTPKMREDTRALTKRLNELLLALRGDTVAREHNEQSAASISELVGSVSGELRASTAKPTQTQLDTYKLAAEEFAPVLEKLRALVTVDLANLEKQLDAIGAPHTPGRIPDWKDK
jgi:photosystem II stability/assembly factor-like uncharacterized protein